MVRSFAWAVTALSVLGVSNALPEYHAHDRRASPTPSPTSAAPAATSPGMSCTSATVPNGDFESGSLGPWTAVGGPMPSGAAASAQVVAGGENSAYAVQFAVEAEIRQTFRACAHTQYELSYDYKVLSTDPGCTVYGHAGTDRFHFSGHTVQNLTVGDWTTAAFIYNSDSTGFGMGVGLACSATDADAKVLMDNIKIGPPGSVQPQGCPTAVSLSNGDFETGQTAPWAGDPGNNLNPAQLSVVSPGYDSQSALQFDYPAAEYTDWFVRQTIDSLCVGSTYQVSYAVNWANYTGVPGGVDESGCYFVGSIETCGSGNQGIAYATTAAGWTQHSYTCTARTNGQANFDAGVLCDQGVEPAFSVQVDNIAVQLVGSGTSKRSATLGNVARLGGDSAPKDHLAQPRWV